MGVQRVADGGRLRKRSERRRRDSECDGFDDAKEKLRYIPALWCAVLCCPVFLLAALWSFRCIAAHLSWLLHLFEPTSAHELHGVPPAVFAPHLIFCGV